MVTTDLTLDRFVRESPDWPRTRRIFNILADRVETVTLWIARRVLKNIKTGARIDRLALRLFVTRFPLAPLRRRGVFDRRCYRERPRAALSSYLSSCGPSNPSPQA